MSGKRSDLAQQTHGAHSLEQHVAHDVPTLEAENLEERQHGVADVIEIKVARIRPAIP